jgi:hypothetical protein
MPAKFEVRCGLIAMALILAMPTDASAQATRIIAKSRAPSLIYEIWNAKLTLPGEKQIGPVLLKSGTIEIDKNLFRLVSVCVGLDYFAKVEWCKPSVTSKTQDVAEKN